ncbi:MAG: NADPH:quinone oxidoreductase family protein [Pseudomonadota bacterium]|nr:NADPH:quinone oxidoreductase family protein [Pseudomonadota bacterium]
MKAAIVRSFGTDAGIAIEEIGTPAPEPDGVRIAVHCAGVSYVTALVARGGYQVKPPLPFVPGSDYAGVVDAVGAGVRDLKPGDRVLGGGFGGGFAEFAVTSAAQVVPIGDRMDFATASVFRVSYGTALHALKQRAEIRRGETLLVLGAAGSTGEAAIQVGKALGAHIIASASTADKRDAAIAAGADVAIDSTDADWRGAVRAATAGNGPDVVFDPVGGAAMEPAFRSLGWRGRHLVIGFVGGPIPALPVNLALLKGAALVGVDYRQFREREPDLEAANIRELLDMHAAGHLRPAIGRTFSLDEAGAALAAASDRGPPGRIVLRVRD